jgi:hypothetical protein
VVEAAASIIEDFGDRYMCFFMFAAEAYLERSEPISTLKSPRVRKYSVKKIPQFSQGNNAVDAPASNSDDFLLKYTCFSSTQMNRPIWIKQSLSPP